MCCVHIVVVLSMVFYKTFTSEIKIYFNGLYQIEVVILSRKPNSCKNRVLVCSFDIWSLFRF